MANDEIILEQYNQEWPAKAEEEIDLIKARCSFSWLKTIQHFGSTAIKNIMAKPVLDILIGVEDIEQARELIPVLESMNYLFWQDNPKKDRLFFVKNMPPYGEKRTHHVHIFENSHYEYFARPLFCDYLNEHQDVAAQYENLKISLAAEYSKNRESYTEAKTEFIRKIMQKAMLPHISFEYIQKEHLPLLHEWLNKPHVALWWGNEQPNPSLEQIKDNYSSYIKGYKIEAGIQKPMTRYIIQVWDQCVGYIQYYNAYDFARDGYDLSKIRNLPTSLAAIDFYIGEESYLNKGLASVILNKFISEFVSSHYDNCLVNPDINNKSAICSCENSGFKQFEILENLGIVIMLKSNSQLL